MDAPKRSRIGLACSAIALLVLFGFLFVVYVGLARCAPFGLGGGPAC